MLKRLQQYGARETDLLDVYSKQIRSVLEFAVPVWNGSITGGNILDIERIQKTALHIILGKKYKSYNSALKQSGLGKLADRRQKICLTFAKKAAKHEKFTSWFKANQKQTATRQAQPEYCNVYRRTDRFKKSPIPYLTDMLNKHYAEKK